MARQHDPLHWARKMAKHPVIEEYVDPEPAKLMVAIGKTGHALYESDPHHYWLRANDGSWLEWTRHYNDGREPGPKPPPIPGNMNAIQPQRGGPRWHWITRDDSYNAQRLRIDPAWKPDPV